jgi:hypothetical protein
MENAKVLSQLVQGQMCRQTPTAISRGISLATHSIRMAQVNQTRLGPTTWDTLVTLASMLEQRFILSSTVPEMFILLGMISKIPRET